MSKAIIGTKGLKRNQVAINKSQHPGGVSKIRCVACSLGMMVAFQNGDGKKVLRCPRCKATSVSQRI